MFRKKCGHTGTAAGAALCAAMLIAVLAVLSGGASVAGISVTADASADAADASGDVSGDASGDVSGDAGTQNNSDETQRENSETEETDMETWLWEEDYPVDEQSGDTEDDAADDVTDDSVGAAPYMYLSYSNNNVKNGSYFSSGRTLTITFSDDAVREEDVTFAVRAGEKEGSNVCLSELSAYGISWSREVMTFAGEDPVFGTTQDSIVSYMLRFETDNIYEIKPVVKDADCVFMIADGTAAPYAFTIDTVMPVITITGVENQMAYNGDLLPQIFVRDENCETASLEVTLEGLSHEAGTAEGSWKETADGYSAQLDEFPDTKETDDIYTLSVSAEDLAGNCAYEEIMFSVNRYGSNFMLADAAQKIADQVYVKEAKDIVIYETNVSPVKNRAVYITLDNVRLELEEGTDYRISETETYGGWSQYIYTIPAETFSQDGRYRIIISTTDAAGNRMTNVMKDCEFTFVLDRTPPTVVLTGLEDGVYYEDTKTLTITYYDSIPVTLVRIAVNADLIAEYADERIEEKGGVITMEIERSSEEQSIVVQAADAAGNYTYEHVTVSVLGENALSGGGLFSSGGLLGGLFSGSGASEDTDGRSGIRNTVRGITVMGVLAAAGVFSALRLHGRKRHIRH